MDSAATALFEQSGVVGSEAPALLASWLPTLKRDLRGPSDRVRLELCIVRLLAVGTYGARLGLSREARPLLEEIIAARGELPLTRTVASTR